MLLQSQKCTYTSMVYVCDIRASCKNTELFQLSIDITGETTVVIFSLCG